MLLLVHVQHHHLDDIAHGHHLGGVLDELIAHLRDVYQPVLVHADVHEHAEVDDVPHRAGEDHAGLQVLHFQHVRAEDGLRQLIADVPPRFQQLGYDVPQGGDAHADFLCRFFFPISAEAGGKVGNGSILHIR